MPAPDTPARDALTDQEQITTLNYALAELRQVNARLMAERSKIMDELTDAVARADFGHNQPGEDWVEDLDRDDRSEWRANAVAVLAAIQSYLRDRGLLLGPDGLVRATPMSTVNVSQDGDHRDYHDSTPARDALGRLVHNAVWRSDEECDDQMAGLTAHEVVVDVLANPALVVAALIESGWRPDDDDLRAMGGRPGHYTVSPDDDGGMCIAWRFTRMAAEAACEWAAQQ